jgi:hypothetical protein
MGARLGLPTCLAGRNEPPLDELHGLAIWTAVGGFWRPSHVKHCLAAIKCLGPCRQKDSKLEIGVWWQLGPAETELQGIKLQKWTRREMYY